jgi:hypothetical protein
MPTTHDTTPTRPDSRTSEADDPADDGRTGPTVPDGASPEEAAAIVAALRAHLAAEAAAEDQDGGQSGRTEPWVMANRLQRVGVDADSLVIAGATDAWTASSRTAHR